ncbi:hypothetical protein [Streptomyces sp. NPDC047869]|uniref:ATP-dependent DNA ligase n=1 Tax=Streptomyces sp. NPDC047869 TaxID=3154709 RepID=UPI0034520054
MAGGLVRQGRVGSCRPPRPLCQPCNRVRLPSQFLELFAALRGRQLLQRRLCGADRQNVRLHLQTIRLAEQWPAHFVAFDLLRISGTDTTRWPYRRRRAALQALFADHRLTAPWTLRPSTTDPATVPEWLTSWTAVGLEGVVFKGLEGVYEPTVRGWRKHKVRETEDAIVGAFTGAPAAPRTLLLGRYDAYGRLRYVGRGAARRSSDRGSGGRQAPHTGRR